MDIRSALLGVSAAVAGAGVSLVAVAWATGSVGWLLADLPGADNDLLRELSLAAFGAVFVVVAAVGASVARTRAAREVPTVAAASAGALAVLSFLAAVIGAGRYAAQAAATALAPVVDDPALLNAPGGDGRLIIGVALALAVAALAVPLTARSRQPAAPTGKVPADR